MIAGTSGLYSEDGQLCQPRYSRWPGRGSEPRGSARPCAAHDTADNRHFTQYRAVVRSSPCMPWRTRHCCSTSDSTEVGSARPCSPTTTSPSRSPRTAGRSTSPTTTTTCSPRTGPPSRSGTRHKSRRERRDRPAGRWAHRVRCRWEPQLHRRAPTVPRRDILRGALALSDRCKPRHPHPRLQAVAGVPRPARSGCE